MTGIGSTDVSSSLGVGIAPYEEPSELGALGLLTDVDSETWAW